ncbi:MAG TPA: cytochrome P450 [Pseudonocardia sp.]
MTQSAISPGPRVEPGYSSSPYEPVAPPVRTPAEVNLVDPDLYQFGDPHAAWKVLREQAPVFWNEAGALGTEGNGFWAVTRYQDIFRVLRDSAHFSSTKSPFLDVTADMIGEDAMLNMDPPRQRQLRRVTQHLFTPRHMAAWEGELTALADRLIDEVIEAGACDFAADIAVKFPIYAACALLGVADADADQVTAISTTLHNTASSDALVEFNQVGMQVFQRLIAERKDDPGPGIVGQVLRGQTDEGAPLTDSEVFAYLWLLFVGGLDSATHAITGSLQAMFHHPDQLRLLRDRDRAGDPDIWTTAVEELMRWTTIAQHHKRYCVADAEVAGQPIRAGEYITVFLPSANRDEGAFPDPYRFDVTRSGTAIATFGHGPHTCLGLHYARLELRTLFGQIVRRMPDIAPSAPMTRGRGFSILLSPIHHQPVAFTPGPRTAGR